jgi:hypothetical protein
MVVIWACATVLLAVAAPADKVTLREVARVGDLSHATIELKASGMYKPAVPPGAPAASPLALKVETRLEFDDRVAAIARDGSPRQAVRQVTRAGATINGEIRPSSSSLRPEMTTLVAERKDGAVTVFSAGGPLTRSELELVQGPGDPLALADLLPPSPVAVGEHWTIGADAARSLSGYDALAANTLEATLEAATEEKATIRLLGSIRGAALGGEGSMACEGSFTFDRAANRIANLSLRRAETRAPGPIEAGLDVKSTLDVAIVAAPGGGVLADDGVVERALAPTPGRDLLQFNAPDGKYSLLHDRNWHLYWDDPRQVVLKRLDRGELVAQANLMAGPDAGKGRHQDPEQFREDVRKALGPRFESIVGQGEVGGVAAGHYRYKVSARGKQGDAVILWHYYLIASPAGQQIIATFTLGQAQEKAFGDQDLLLIGSLEWKMPAAP